MKLLRRVLGAVDRWQRRTPVVAPAFAVQKKFNDDRLGQFVVALGWYGFVSIYPLLLVVTTVLGFIGAASLGGTIVSTLHEFPVVGSNFNPAQPSHDLHGSTIGLVIGLLGLLYGTRGVMLSAQRAMAQPWNLHRGDRPGWLPRLTRSLLGLLIIGGSFVVNAAVAAIATGHGQSWLLRILVIAGMLALNSALFFASFRTLTPSAVATRLLLPGAVLGAIGFTLLITVGSGLIQHQVRHSSATYGQFGVVIGLVGFLFLLAKISLYGAELNSVLARHLWPRSLVSGNPTTADSQVLRYLSDEVPQPAAAPTHLASGKPT
ncbi:MAG: YihY/virulence factor BrkB family protein [Acidimicrobiales bacterium]|jgi:uncharacterized BrkB/YihY/UPF0761 family membrane protein